MIVMTGNNKCEETIFANIGLTYENIDASHDLNSKTV